MIIMLSAGQVSLNNQSFSRWNHVINIVNLSAYLLELPSHVKIYVIPWDNDHVWSRSTLLNISILTCISQSSCQLEHHLKQTKQILPVGYRIIEYYNYNIKSGVVCQMVTLGQSLCCNNYQKFKSAPTYHECICIFADRDEVVNIFGQLGSMLQYCYEIMIL